jgi:CRISPR-associated endonuclease Cas2
MVVIDFGFKMNRDQINNDLKNQSDQKIEKGWKESKGGLTLKILEFLADESSALGELLELFLWTRFRRGGISRAEFAAHFEKERARERTTREADFISNEKHKISSLIHKFQKMGLVKNENNKGKKGLWSITQKGIDKIVKLKEKILKSKNKPILPSKNYLIKPSEQTIIISFDIEEFEKEKRAWLRDVLKSLNYTMLQKSVWIGTNQLPKDFINDLKKLNILKNVKIFSVMEKGNIFEE